MSYAYFKNNMTDKEAVFHLFFRKNPFGQHYTIAAGLAEVIQYLKQLQFSIEDIRYLHNLKSINNQPLFDEAFLNYLQRLKWTFDIDAVEEGTVVFPHQPLLRIKAPIIQAQLLESALLNIINFSTLIATKSNRVVQAAQGDPVLEFGMRRAQGPNGAMMASRAAYIGGCNGTSNVLAGKKYNIPVKGTHAHSWIMCFENEEQAFEAYAKAMPNNCILLVDTYDTVEGVKKAIKIIDKMKKSNHFDNGTFTGIRLDSGDLKTLSIQARELLDQAGYMDTKIVASNDLNEHKIKNLKASGAKIDIWGVGTQLATAYDQVALGGVYKLAAIRDIGGTWDYKIKLSENKIKISNPGILSIKRYFDNDIPQCDVIYDNNISNEINELKTFQEETVFIKNHWKKANILQPIFRNGQLVYQSPTIHQMREKALKESAVFSSVLEYKSGLEKELFLLKNKMIGDNNK